VEFRNQIAIVVPDRQAARAEFDRIRELPPDGPIIKNMKKWGVVDFHATAC
jgi:hypothetical protein